MTEEEITAAYDWLSVFEFGQRTLDRMQHDPDPYAQLAAEWFKSHLQKVWEQERHKWIIRCMPIQETG